jgi:hypothetical protein
MTVEKRADPSRRAWPLFVLAILIGLGTLVPFAMQAYRDVRIIWFYRPATCKVISSSLYTTTTRFRQNVRRSSSHPEFTYQLQVDGRWYTAIGFDNMEGRTAHPAETLAFKRGQSYPCWYDPWNPEQAVLRKQMYKPFYFGLAIPLLFLLVGGNMLVRSLRPVPPATLDGRGVGEALAVRLSPEITGGRAVGCLSAAAIIFTAGVVAFFGYLIRSGRLFSGDGLTTLALFIAGIDAFIIYHLIRSIRGLGVPEPIVEIDHEPLHPGEEGRVFIRQAGPARFEAFKVSLVCEEQGQRGTRRVHSHQMVNRKDVDITLSSDLTESVTIEIPADAPASVKELQTIITWKIVVHRKAKFGDADRDFVFRMLREREAQ